MLFITKVLGLLFAIVLGSWLRNVQILKPGWWECWKHPAYRWTAEHSVNIMLDYLGSERILEYDMKWEEHLYCLEFSWPVFASEVWVSSGKKDRAPLNQNRPVSLGPYLMGEAFAFFEQVGPWLTVSFIFRNCCYICKCSDSSRKMNCWSVTILGKKLQNNKMKDKNKSKTF